MQCTLDQVPFMTEAAETEAAVSVAEASGGQLTEKTSSW